jgi:hypothetical protein
LFLKQQETTMDNLANVRSPREPWKKGKLVGQKAPFRLKEIWAIRVRLQLADRRRELALVQDLVLAVDGIALGPAVLEEFLALGGGDECHGFDSCVGRTAPGPRGVERGSSKPEQQGSR